MLIIKRKIIIKDGKNNISFHGKSLVRIEKFHYHFMFLLNLHEFLIKT